MRIAIVHDFLREYGGAERVLEVLHEIWPEAPIYTAFVDFSGLGPHAERIKKWDIRPSWVQKNFLVKKLHSPLRFLAPEVWESFDFREYDVVISSASWYITKGIITQPSTLHVCYLHSVPRALYGYETKMDWKKHLFTRVYGSIVNTFLRQYDFLSSQRVDCFIANSEETGRRIKKFYRRDSTVIYPPVELLDQRSLTFRTGQAKIKVQKQESLQRKDENSYYLCVSRLGRAKRIDLAIKACNKLKIPFWIVGKGSEEKYLRSISGETIAFLGEISDNELSRIYSDSKALIFSAVDEDFGIVPVEAMSFGKPVIAYKSGGVQETVIDGKTGVFFEELKEECLIKAIKRLDTFNIKPEDCKKRALEFSKEKFKEKITRFIEQKIKGNSA